MQQEILKSYNKLFTYILRSDLKILYKKNENKIIFWNRLSFIYFYLYNYYFIYSNKDKHIFLFDLKKDYNLFLKIFFLYYNKIWKLFYLRLFLRGLGYKIKKITRARMYGGSSLVSLRK